KERKAGFHRRPVANGQLGRQADRAETNKAARCGREHAVTGWTSRWSWSCGDDWRKPTNQRTAQTISTSRPRRGRDPILIGSGGSPNHPRTIGVNRPYPFLNLE